MFHCTSRETKDHLFRQWYQLSRCCQWTSCHQQNASIHITDGHSTNYLATEGCEWKFIPPHGPYFGGLWEAAVKSMKYHLLRTLGSPVATYEELCTLLAEIEAWLNTRPLCDLSDDTYLFPGHFLIGEPLTQLPAADFTDVKCNRLSRWQTYQQQLQKFWQCWSSDNLQSLQQRQRWQRTSPNLQPGDLVLLREDNTAPLHWPTAVISDIHPGKNGIIQVVTISTPKGVFKRPIIKICPLPRVNSELYCHCFGGGSVLR